MDEDIEGESKLSVAMRARRIRDWLTRPRTMRVVAPAAFVLAVALVAVGALLLTTGGDEEIGSQAGIPDEENVRSFIVSATAYPVPPGMVEGVSYPVPERQPFADFGIQIDTLDVDARVVELGVDESRVPQVPYDAAMVAWYEFSARPGTGGNAVLAGHVRWGGERGVFADLEKLDKGDVIGLKWKDGRESNYAVVANFDVDASDPDSLRVMAPTSVDTITLITCGGTFVPDRYNPLGGDFTERTVVQARLIQPSVAAFSR